MKGDTAAPKKIGRYEVVDHLGAGGMGVVYLATDPLLRRTVAIKVLPSQDEELRERFAREARSAASLRHHNVVTIYDVGEDDGKPFLAMEFIDGESMAELIRRRAYLTIERRLRLMIELCAGLGYAHRSGIIHRDIKPGNLMITAEGALKILDFGLARITTEATSTGLTGAGSILGTPHYMSPEQVEGNPVDPRSDIFSVGVVLYELLTYQKAYAGETAHVVLHNIIHAAPAPIQNLIPDIDPDLAKIVERAMEKSPERRFQDLGAFAADLERVRARLAKVPGSETLIQPRPASGPKPPPVRSEVPPSREARTRANLDLLAQRRTNQVDAHVKAAVDHMAAGRYVEAVAECENAMLLNPQSPRALELLAQAQTALDDEQVRQLLEQARARLASGELTEALALVDETLMLRADLAEAKQLRQEVKEHRRERERAAERARAAKSALDRAMRNLEDGAFEAAARSASEVLAYDPGNEGALDVRRRAAEALEVRRRQHQLDQRASEAVERALLLSAGGNPRSALTLLEDFTPAHPMVTDALGRIRVKIDALEQKEREEAERQRQRAIEDQRRRERVIALKAEAIEALQARRFADATRAVMSASQEVPDDVELQELASQIRTAEEEAAAATRKRQAVEQHLDVARGALKKGDVASASKAIKSVLTLSPNDPEALELRERVRLTRQQREATAAISEAKGLAGAGDFTAALDLLSAFWPQSLVASAIADLKAEQARVEQERAAEVRRLADEEARRKAEEEARRKADEDARRKAEDEQKRAAAVALQRQEEARLAKQRQEEARLEKQREEAARLAKQRQEEARLEKQREEEARLAKQRQEEARLEKQREEAARLVKQRQEEARLEKQRQEEARLEKQRQEEARLAKQRQEEARLEKQRQEEARRKADEDARRKAEDDQKRAAALALQRQEEARLEKQRQDEARLEQERLLQAGAGAEDTLRVEREQVFPPLIQEPVPATPAPLPAASMPVPAAAKIPPAMMAIAGVIVLVLIGVAWFATRDRAPSPTAGVGTSGEATPVVTPPPSGDLVAANVPPSGGAATGAGATATPTATSTATPAVADSGANINLIHKGFIDAMGRNNFEQAANVLVGAPATARKDPTLAADAGQIVAKVKSLMTEALTKARNSSAARASAEYQTAQDKRTEAINLERRRQLPEAAREYIAAGAGFARALNATPSPVASAAPPVGNTGGSLSPTGVTVVIAPPPATPTPTATSTPEPGAPPTPSPSPTPSPKPPVDTTAADNTAIREALSQYVAAYQRRDTAAVRRIHPGLAANLDLSTYEFYSMSLDITRITINGDRAAVQTVRSVRAKVRRAAEQTNTAPAEFTMRRAGNGWEVERVR